MLNGAGDETYVWLLDTQSNTARKRKVIVGRLNGSKNILITKGLQGGETVITAGVTQLEEGMQVRPWEKQREGK